ncbi:MAG: tetratricopeptide repeat protein [Eubacterium sp.]
MVTEKAKKKTRFIAVGAIAVVIIIAIVAFFMVKNGLNQKNYQVALVEGKKYFAENDFKNAVSSYQAAVDKNPESEDATLGLANSYMGLKDYSNAKSTLRKALMHIKSPELEMLLSRINYLYYGIGDGFNMAQEEIGNQSQSVTLNTTTWKEIGKRTFSEYKKKYPNAKLEKTEKDPPKLMCSDLKTIFYYENNDALESNGNPKANAYPSRIELMDLAVIFDNFNDVLSYEKAKEIFGKQVTKKQDDILGCEAIFATYGDNILVVACDENGNVLSKNAQNYILVGSEALKKCAVNGKVSDATTGKAVKAEITITPLSDSKNSVKVNANSNSGNYSTELDYGKYTVSVHAENYIDIEEKITIDEVQKLVKKDFALSPELKNGEIRIVLEWGSTPRDLDSYLIVDEKERVYFGNKKLSDSQGDIASLDLDDRNGKGPETITIYRPNRNYRYIINDFESDNSQSVKNSKATVKVYMPGKDTVTIKGPSGNGNIWNVLEINNGELKTINEMQEMPTSLSGK